MEIQYAMFCAHVQFPQKPGGSVVLTKPIANLTIEGAKSAEMDLPLFVTFLDDGGGGGNNLDVKIANSSGEIIATRDFKFNWRKNNPVQGECFVVPLPEMHNSDTLTFSLFINGENKYNTRIPITIKP